MWLCPLVRFHGFIGGNAAVFLLWSSAILLVHGVHGLPAPGGGTGGLAVPVGRRCLSRSLFREVRGATCLGGIRSGASAGRSVLGLVVPLPAGMAGRALEPGHPDGLPRAVVRRPLGLAASSLVLSSPLELRSGC